MKTWKLWAGIFLVFLTGICIGSAGTGLYVRHAVISLFQGGQPAVTRLVMKRLTRKLDLSGSQQVVIGREVHGIQDRLQELRLRNRPETLQIIKTGVNRIRENLRPDQQRKLDVLITRLKAQWAARMKINEAG